MDNERWISRAREGAAALELAVPEGSWASLKWLADELVRWNRRVNLTAITDPWEVLEKHILDSLAIQKDLAGVSRLLDLGAGAGFPGLPAALSEPRLEVQLVDAVAKKVGFMKHAAAHLGLAGRVRALHASAAGAPEHEGIGRADAVVSRALMEVGPWLLLARAYVAPGGRVLAMVSRVDETGAQRAAESANLSLASVRRFTLPWSDAPRAVLRFDLR